MPRMPNESNPLHCSRPMQSVGEGRYKCPVCGHRTPRQSPRSTGRPETGTAKSAAERMREYRARKKLASL